MRALSIRQPYAELILRGIKTAELRSMSTTIVGNGLQRSQVRDQKSGGGNQNASSLTSGFRPLTSSARVPIWSADLRVGTPPAWMIELAEQVKLIEAGAILPTGVIVGSAVIESVTPPDPSDAGALFHWHLTDVKRAKKFRKPRGHPQPVWFRAF